VKPQGGEEGRKKSLVRPASEMRFFYADVKDLENSEDE
jgi:hypothetical protein